MNYAVEARDPIQSNAPIQNPEQQPSDRRRDPPGAGAAAASRRSPTRPHTTQASGAPPHAMPSAASIVGRASLDRCESIGTCGRFRGGCCGDVGWDGNAPPIQRRRHRGLQASKAKMGVVAVSMQALRIERWLTAPHHTQTHPHGQGRFTQGLVDRAPVAPPPRRPVDRRIECTAAAGPPSPPERTHAWNRSSTTDSHVRGIDGGAAGGFSGRSVGEQPTRRLVLTHTNTLRLHAREGIHSASYSEKYFDKDNLDALHNKNVEWLRYQAFWWLYLGALPFLVVLLGLTVMEGKELAEVLTVTHVIHNTVRASHGHSHMASCRSPPGFHHDGTTPQRSSSSSSTG